MNLAGFHHTFTASAGSVLTAIGQHDTLPQCRIQNGLAFIYAEERSSIAVFDFKLSHKTASWYLLTGFEYERVRIVADVITFAPLLRQLGHEQRSMISFFTTILRFIFRGILLIAYLVFLLIPNLMLVNYYRRLETEEGGRKADHAGVRIARRLAWFFGVRTVIVGTPANGAALIAANHISWLDIPVLHSGCAMGFVGKAEIDRWPVFRFIASTGGTIFHQRGNHDSATDVSAVMSERMRQGRKVAIFPEGGIKPGASVRMFHARLFRSAVDVGCLVQPVMVRYMRDGERDDDISFREDESMLVNFSRLLGRPSVIAEVHFLPPIISIDKPRRELADAVRAAVIAAYES